MAGELQLIILITGAAAVAAVSLWVLLRYTRQRPESSRIALHGKPESAPEAKPEPEPEPTSDGPRAGTVLAVLRPRGLVLVDGTVEPARWRGSGEPPARGGMVLLTRSEEMAGWLAWPETGMEQGTDAAAGEGDTLDTGVTAPAPAGSQEVRP